MYTPNFVICLHVSIWILLRLGNVYNLYVIATVSMWFLLSLFDYYCLYVIATVSSLILLCLCEYKQACVYKNIFVSTEYSLYLNTTYL